jgi:hypothetical protein
MIKMKMLNVVLDVAVVALDIVILYLLYKIRRGGN